MRKYLCWDPNLVSKVIDSTAEDYSDEFFRAVHCDWDLVFSDPVGKNFSDIQENHYHPITMSAFKDQFLDENRNFFLATILGDSGSGKSHLVHWLRLNIPEDDTRVVINVKKQNTNLVEIVKMIINQLPSANRENFLQKLEQSENDAPDKEKKKIRLLNQLGEEIFAERVNEETSELESELIKGLPDLLGDPNLKKKYFLKEGSVISDLVEHTFERSKDHIDKDSDEVERRRFTNEDLPSGGSDYSEASKEAR